MKVVRITHTDSLRKYESQPYISFLGSVVIEHDGVVMTCDSAHMYEAKNMVEAFSNVVINKANGATASCQYLKYVGSTHTAYMNKSVQIIDGPNTLNTENLVYNIKTKIGKYSGGGTITNTDVSVSSMDGTYNGYTQQSYFKKDVIVTSEKYNIESNELTYNLKSKVVKFLAPSTIISEGNTIETKAGTYDTKNGKAVFTSRTRIENEDQIIEANKINYDDKQGKANASGDVVLLDKKNDSQLFADKAEYNKTTGYSKAIGNVLILQEGGKSTLEAKEVENHKKSGYTLAVGNVRLIDTNERSKLLAGQVEYNEYTQFMLASKNPKLITVNDNDTIYMRADTMMSCRKKELPSIQERTSISKPKEKEAKTHYKLLFADSSYISNQEEAKVIIANHRVKLYSDSLQLVCDSLSYLQSDSLFQLYKSPILWSKNQQANADTIYVKTKASKLSELNLLYNSLLVSETGFAGTYDQVSGAYIDAYFDENQIQHVYVNQNAESLYYAKDDDNKFLGANKSACASMDVYFSNKELDKIVMHEDPNGTFYPMDKLSADKKLLAAFKLFTNQKPASKTVIIED